MRRVAAALDTGAASLYVYVANREALFQAMLDRVTATIELEDADPSRWRIQLHTLLRRMHRALVAHPGIAAMTLADPPTTEAILRLTENLLGILLAGGLDPQDAAWTCDILVLLVTAVASEDDVRRSRGRGEDDDPRGKVDELYRDLRRLTAGPLPSSSPPTPRRWSPVTARSGFASPSTLLSTASWQAQPAADACVATRQFAQPLKDGPGPEVEAGRARTRQGRERLKTLATILAPAAVTRRGQI